MEDWQKFYTVQSVVTDPGEYKKLYDLLPADVPSICRILQGLLIHLYLAPLYGVNLAEERKDEVKIRQIARQLARIFELADLPLSAARPPDKRMVGTCRDYAVLLTSILRHKGIPARMRVGFAAYLKPGTYENHYLCQYWNKAQNRWVMVDAQLDEVQRNALNIRFDPCDVPEEQFRLTGQTWQVCRQGKMAPELFGVLEFRGLWFIGGCLIHEILALNKVESHPWDIWPLMPRYRQKEFSPDYLGFLDRLAALTSPLSPDFTEVRATYQAEKKLPPRPNWKP